MALVVKTKPGVFGGVSKQTESLRKDNQVAEMINCSPSLVLGTTRRNNVSTGGVAIDSNSSFIYDYTRSEGRTHLITVDTDGTINAQTIGEGSKTVTMEEGVKSYLAHTDPKDLSAITIGDTTFMVNSKQVVTTKEIDTTTIEELDDLYKSDPGVVEVHAKQTAYYWLSRSSNNPDHTYNYVVELDDVKYEADMDNSNDAAELLANKIKFKGVSTTLSAVADTEDDSLLTITAADGSSFEIKAYDSNDNISIELTPNSDKTSWTVKILRADDEFDYYTLVVGGNYYSVVNNTIKNVRDDFVNKINDKACYLITTERNENGFNAEAIGSIIRIWKDSFEDFTFKYWDSFGSLASFGWKYNVSKIQDLPASFPWEGAVVRVNGDASEDNTNSSFYVIRWGDTWKEFTSRITYSDENEDGHYERYLPMLTNMPIIVERTSDGSFAARLLKSSDQLKPPLVGNDTNNKDPYFVGKTIKQLFYVNGRMCVVSGDALTFSETNVIWNFYITTVVDVLDSDAIEINIASERVLDILNVTIFQSGLLIMTTEGQYLFNTENGITPKSVFLNKLSDYAYSDRGGTIYDGDSIVFSGVTGDTARLYRYRVARLTSENKAIDLTIQVPTYIQGSIQRIVNYIEDGTIIVMVNNSKKLYIYNEVISGDQLVQSSWHTWDFSNILSNDILHIFVANNHLYFISLDGVFKIKLGAVHYDSNYSHKDLDTYNYESRIEMSLFRPKKSQTQIETPLGRVQLRAYTFSLQGKALLEIYREDTNKIYTRDIQDKRPVNVLSNANTTKISIVNKEDKPFVVSGYSITASYRQVGQDII